MKSYKNTIKTFLQKSTRFLPKRNKSHYIYKDSNDPYSTQKIQTGGGVVLSIGKTIFDIWWVGIKKSLSLIIHKKTLKIIGGLFGLTVLGVVGLFLWYWPQLDSIDDLQNQRIVSAKVYDRTGTVVLYNIFGTEQRDVVKLSEVPHHTQSAVIVAEDDNFYSHPGIDVMGVARAAWQNIIERRVSQGGSTITQQFVKNALLTPEEGSAQRTFGRKIKEVILSVELEIKYSKDEILELYLNEIPYGSSIYGIATASQKYFGKPVQELSLGESALLAALPKAPSYYLNNPDVLEQRRQYILTRMYNLGYINKEQFDIAVDESVVISQIVDDIKAPHFVLEVKEQLEEQYGSALVERGGLKVITTLDAQMQEIAEQAVQEYAEQNQNGYRATNASVVVIDHKTGEVLAMVGSRDYFNEDIDGNVNVAMRPRQPGSSFKPFAYAQALRKGYTIDTVVYDTPTEFNPLCSWDTDQVKDRSGLQCYSPENYDNEYVGPQPLKEALAQSRNIPAVKVLYLAGIEDTVNLAKDMGITTLDNVEDDQWSLVLGSGEVTLLEETSAYGVFATGGTYAEPMFIREVTNASGSVNDSFVSKTHKVLDQNITEQITYALSVNEYRVPTFGPNSVLNTPGIASAVKTGTTQREYQNGRWGIKNAWTIGYTPSISVGVWVGNNNGDVMTGNAGGSRLAGPIWNKFLRDAYKEKQTSDDRINNEFVLPNPTTESFSRAQVPKTSKDILNGVVDGEFPHSILYFVNKNNPKSGVPKNPKNDRLYEHFERPVRAWAGVQYDKDELLDTTGIISFVTPAPNQIINKPEVVLEFIISAPQEIKTVNIYLDGELFDEYEINATSLSLSDVILQDIKEGFHNITVRAISKTGSNSYTATQSFSYIKEDVASPSLILPTPTVPEIINQEDDNEEINSERRIFIQNNRSRESSNQETIESVEDVRVNAGF